LLWYKLSTTWRMWRRNLRKVPPQHAKHLEMAATKNKNILRLQEQNALATAKKKDKLEAQKIAVNRRKKRELDQVKIDLQQEKEMED
jgi:hypothetical protein